MKAIMKTNCHFKLEDMKENYRIQKYKIKMITVPDGVLFRNYVKIFETLDVLRFDRDMQLKFAIKRVWRNNVSVYVEVTDGSYFIFYSNKINIYTDNENIVADLQQGKYHFIKTKFENGTVRVSIFNNDEEMILLPLELSKHKKDEV
jgi:hypothetical protein